MCAYAHAYVCTSLCIYIHLHAYSYICIRIYIYINTYKYVSIFIYTYTFTCIFRYIHTYIKYKSTYIYTYKHLRHRTHALHPLHKSVTFHFRRCELLLELAYLSCINGRVRLQPLNILLFYFALSLHCLEVTAGHTCIQLGRQIFGMRGHFTQLILQHRTETGSKITGIEERVPHTAMHHGATFGSPATHCNTRQHTATHGNTLQQAVSLATLKHKHCFTRLATQLQHTATHCNTLQHTATSRPTIHNSPATPQLFRRPPLHVQSRLPVSLWAPCIQLHLSERADKYKSQCFG